VNYVVAPHLQISLIHDRLSIRYFPFSNFYLFQKSRAGMGNCLAPEHPGGVNVCVCVRAWVQKYPLFELDMVAFFSVSQYTVLILNI
jgi:hypothetical protein